MIYNNALACQLCNSKCKSTTFCQSGSLHCHCATYLGSWWHSWMICPSYCSSFPFNKYAIKWGELKEKGYKVNAFFSSHLAKGIGQKSKGLEDKQTLVLFPTIVQKLKPLAIIHSSIMDIKCPVKLQLWLARFCTNANIVCSVKAVTCPIVHFYAAQRSANRFGFAFAAIF